MTTFSIRYKQLFVIDIFRNLYVTLKFIVLWQQITKDPAFT